MTEIVLTAPVGNNASQLPVSAIPTRFGVGNYIVNVEGEHYYINSVSGKVLNVTPGVDGTPSKPHNQGAIVSTVDQPTMNNTRIITAPGPYAMRETDFWLQVNQAVPAAISITTPARPIVGMQYTVLDGAGNASLYPITIVSYVDGSTVGKINTNGGSFQFVDNGQ